MNINTTFQALTPPWGTGQNPARFLEFSRIGDSRDMMEIKPNTLQNTVGGTG